MPAITPELDLYLAGGGSLGIGGDDEAADIDKQNQNFQKIDARAITTRQALEALGTPTTRLQQFTGLTANIPTSGMKFGDTFLETDLLKRKWEYDGTNWITAENGMFLIRPSSVVNGSVETDGRVKFVGGQSSITLNGIFSPRFRTYEVEFLVSMSNAASTSIRLTAGGTPYTGATHNSQRISGAGSTVAALGSTSQTAWPGAGLTGTGASVFLSGQWKFTNPSHNSPKFMVVDVQQASGTGAARDYCWLGSVDANLYDGFVFTATGQTLTDTAATFIKVYGKV